MSAHCTCKRDKQNEGCLNDSLRCYHVKSPAPVIMQKERILVLSILQLNQEIYSDKKHNLSEGKHQWSDLKHYNDGLIIFFSEPFVSLKKY